MKKSITLVSFLFVLLIFTSCKLQIDAGYSNAADRYSVKNNDVSPTTAVDVSQKSANTSKVSANASSLLSNTTTTTKSGFYIGVAARDIELGGKFKIQPEAKLIIVEDLNVINVPILVKFNVAEKFNLYAGPSLGLLLDAPNGVKSFNYGADIGASYDLSEKLFLNARYDLGLADLSDFSGASIKLSNLLFGVGYKL